MTERPSHEAGMQHPFKVTLDPVQEFLWAVELSRPIFAILATEASGTVSPESWRSALDAVQLRYPMLSMTIEKNVGERPQLVPLLDVSLPLRLQSLLHDVDLLRLMEAEARVSFGLGQGPLARLSVYTTAERSYIVFAAHHAICDGLTNLMIMADLIKGASGGTLGGAKPILPSVSEMLGLPPVGSYAHLLKQNGSPPATPEVLEDAKMNGVVLETVALERILARARESDATLQSALIVALQRAAMSLSAEWRSGQKLCLSPVNLRHSIGVADAAGLWLSMHPTLLDSTSDSDFWEVARTTREPMRHAHSLEAARAGVNALFSAFNTELDPYQPHSLDPHKFFGYDLMVSNLGVVSEPLGNETLRVEKIFQSATSPENDKAQVVSVITLEGRLHLHHVSRYPIKGLLEGAVSLLQEAVAS
ncbi:MAG: condensation domain-containing protein [Janthinobacterium lividum]